VRVPRDTGTVAGQRHHHRRGRKPGTAVTADAHRDAELTALAATAEAVLAELRSVALAIKALVGPVGADLCSANLTDADLTDADLRDADLDAANLAQVLWSSGTLWPGDMASLMRDRSEELRPGVWQVAGSGNADAETEG